MFSERLSDPMPSWPSLRRLTLAVLSLACGPGMAGELSVHVTGLSTAQGQVGCALFNGPQGFPMDNSLATQVWIPAEATGVICRFDKLAAGRYALAVSHDLNGNRHLDTNLFGIPTEAWGVSGNVRPVLRAPRFEEAAFSLSAEQVLTLEVQVAR